MSGETVFFFVAINERPNETMHLTVYQSGNSCGYVSCLRRSRL